MARRRLIQRSKLGSRFNKYLLRRQVVHDRLINRPPLRFVRRLGLLPEFGESRSEPLIFDLLLDDGAFETLTSSEDAVSIGSGEFAEVVAAEERPHTAA